MTKKIRAAILVASTAVFLITAPALVLYSHGYRFDFKIGKVAKVGGLYIRALPKTSEIFVDNSLKKRTDFLFGTALVENLLPKEYLVQIKKTGYQTWQKNLEVKAGSVVEANDVLLFPEKADLQTLTNVVGSFFPVESGKKTILIKKDSAGLYLTLLDLEDNVEKVILKQKDIAKNSSVSFLDVQWSNDSQMILIDAAVKETEKFYLVNPQDQPIKPTPIDFSGNGNIDKVDFSPFEHGQMIILSREKIFTYNLQTKKSDLAFDNVVAFKTLETDFYFLDKQGFVWKTTSPNSDNLQKLNQTNLEIKPETDYQLEIIGQRIFLKQNDILFLLDDKTKDFSKVIDNASEFTVSGDGRKLAYLNQGEIWVDYLEGELGQPQKDQGEKNLLARFSEKTSQLFWLDNNHLMFVWNDQIKAIETDTRDKPNIMDIGSFDSPRIFWSTQNKNALVLTKDNLSILTNLFP
jgi:hypothetical protein